MKAIVIHIKKEKKLNSYAILLIRIKHREREERRYKSPCKPGKDRPPDKHTNGIC